MQLYKGFDIGTAKVSKKIRKEIPHHLLDILDLDQECTSSKYVKLAVPIIDRLLKKRVIPIIVGGTHVYLKSLIWESIVSSSEDMELPPSLSDEKYSGLSSEELHRQLFEIDPERASSLHHNDRRRIIRSIEIFKKNNVKFSEICKIFPYKLRYENCLLFWIRNNRIEDNIETRVSEMINEGLLEEAFLLRERIINCEKFTGILQGIGYKELKDILLRRKKIKDITEEEITEFKRKLKLKTLQYSKKQEKYIRKHLFRDADVKTLTFNGGMGDNKILDLEEFAVHKEQENNHK
ncbi:tRNA delta-isopentenylpyrophosphate transferase [Cryptosporidium ryanae]|uniref:tRNA delta-isopentenylpyrophosphate transferase n=1 Tax=Cryptosporidium ryanae TaxID=515981 RepID=UPI00351A5BEA|nr:tRNA delta-isopentenylpyrophosphate transferase [Cryptosporidium ryanae]